MKQNTGLVQFILSNYNNAVRNTSFNFLKTTLEFPSRMEINTFHPNCLIGERLFILAGSELYSIRISKLHLLIHYE